MHPPALQVPCVAVVENMSYFDADDKRYFPFGQGSGACSALHRPRSCLPGVSGFPSALSTCPCCSWCCHFCSCFRCAVLQPFSLLHTHPCSCCCSAGDRIVREFGLPNLVRFPIVPDLSAAGDSGKPVVVTDPTGPTAQAYLELGAAVVREVSRG